jgi:RNA polymerase sigma-70 factor (ECF subfamily)
MRPAAFLLQGGTVTTPVPSDELRQLYAQARAAWPAFEVPFAAFAARVAALENTPATARDLYLACACADGNPAALRQLEDHYLAPARGAVARIDANDDFVAEVFQLLRERLLTGPGAKIREYRGQGALAGWVRTAAVRAALNLRQAQRGQQQRELAIEQLGDPEIALFERRHQADLNRALHNALCRLTPRQRLLLRFYYVEQLTLSRIAALEGVSLSTVFRRLNAVIEAVLTDLRHELATLLGLSTQSVDSLMRELRHGISFSISRVLDEPG